MLSCGEERLNEQTFSKRLIFIFQAFVFLNQASNLQLNKIIDYQ